MLLFYKYLFYRIYSFFEKVKSSNAYNVASLVLMVYVLLIIGKLHFIILKFIFHRNLEYQDLAIPYALLSVFIYVVNYMLLIRGLKYLKIEDVFIQRQYPKYFDRLFLILGVIIPILLII
jgi:hypothetical protein